MPHLTPPRFAHLLAIQLAALACFVPLIMGAREHWSRPVTFGYCAATFVVCYLIRFAFKPAERRQNDPA